MNRLAKYTVAALVAGIPATASAQVEYSIEMDPTFPSVVYIEYDLSTLPQVYTAPESEDGPPVIRGGDVNDGAAASPSSDSQDRDSADRTQTSSNGSNGSGGGSFDQRASDRLNQLGTSPKEIENMILEREIEDRVYDQIQNNR